MEDLAHPMTAPAGAGQRVAVIGGGYAGMASAVELADSGLAVSVFEAGPELGGRARRVRYRDVVLDNGLHIGIGAYSHLLELCERVRNGEPGSADTRSPAGSPTLQHGWWRGPLDWHIEGGLHLRAPAWPAPLHLAGALLGARRLSLTARWDAIRLIAGLRRSRYRIEGDPTVADWLARERQGEAIVAALWGPLCVAALNTPLRAASAQVFANVLRDSLGANRPASDLLLPATDLTELFPAPAARHVEARGGTVLCGHRIARVESAGDGRSGFRLTCHRGGKPWIASFDAPASDAPTFDALILAVAPRALADLTVDWPALQAVHRCVSNYAHEPITSIYLQYPPAVVLAQPMIGLAQDRTDRPRPGQWVFDRGALTGQRGLLGVVLSTAVPAGLEGRTLADAVHGQLVQLIPGLPAPLWSKVITEKFATFACTPGLQRPGTVTAVAGVFIAGDHVASDYPATLESAVRSGQAAAAAVVEYLRVQR